LTPETSAAPGRQEAKGQATGLPRPAHDTRARLADTVSTEGFIYRHRCDDPLNPPWQNSVIMVRAVVSPGQTGQNWLAPARPEDGELG
jgi:hypothetical protein